MTTSSFPITRVFKYNSVGTTDQLAVEEPLQIQVLYGPSGEEQTRNIAITMRTPGSDNELAAGFLFTEDIVNERKQIVDVIPGAAGENNVLVILRGWYTPQIASSDRNFYVSSSCGVCGKASIDALKKASRFTTSGREINISADQLYALPALLRTEQRLFHSTGGLHACAVFNEEGKLILLREDVGRHNALDKLIGKLFLEDQLPAHDMILVLSGRASFELVQKASMAGIRIIAAIGAPSSLAVELAIESDITLIGFLKEDRFNIYSSPGRIDQSSQS
jgi:FdhD protein